VEVGSVIRAIFSDDHQLVHREGLRTADPPCPLPEIEPTMVRADGSRPEESSRRQH
jgi:hypothetical protein